MNERSWTKRMRSLRGLFAKSGMFVPRSFLAGEAAPLLSHDLGLSATILDLLASFFQSLINPELSPKRNRIEENLTHPTRKHDRPSSLTAKRPPTHQPHTRGAATSQSAVLVTPSQLKISLFQPCAPSSEWVESRAFEAAVTVLSRVVSYSS